MSDSILTSIVSGVIGILLTMVGSAFGMLIIKINRIERVGIDTHTLVNNNMRIQLKLNMELARRMAKVSETEEDMKIADTAEEVYEEHLRKQAIVDKG